MKISIIWDTQDVWEVRSDLTEEQANEVLKAADRNHDANIGINWDVLKTVADTMFPKNNIENDIEYVNALQAAGFDDWEIEQMLSDEPDEQ